MISLKTKSGCFAWARYHLWLSNVSEYGFPCINQQCYFRSPAVHGTKLHSGWCYNGMSSDVFNKLSLIE